MASAAAAICGIKRRREEESEIVHLDGEEADKKDKDTKTNPNKKPRPSDAELLATSKVALEEGGAPKVSERSLLGKADEWFTDDQLFAVIVDQTLCDTQTKRAEGVTLQVLYPSPVSVVVHALNREKSALRSVVPNSNKIIFQPLGEGFQGGVTSHWCALIFDGPARRITYWDPFGLPIKDVSLRKAIATHFDAFSLSELDFTLQSNGYQCGAWVALGFRQYYNHIHSRVMAEESFDLLQAGKLRLNDLSYRSSESRAQLNSDFIAQFRKHCKKILKYDVDKGILTPSVMDPTTTL